MMASASGALRCALRACLPPGRRAIVTLPSMRPSTERSTGLRKLIISPEPARPNAWLVRNATTYTLEATSRRKRPGQVFDFNPKGGVEWAPAALMGERL